MPVNIVKGIMNIFIELFELLIAFFASHGFKYIPELKVLTHFEAFDN